MIFGLYYIGSCEYIKPDQNWKVMFFVAIISGIVAIPLALFLDFMIQYYLLAPTMKGRRKIMSMTSTSTSSVEKFQFMKIKQQVSITFEMIMDEIKTYRSILSDEERNDFDVAWGIDSNTGELFASKKAIETRQKGLCYRKFLCNIRKQVDVESVLCKDLQNTFENYEKEMKHLMTNKNITVDDKKVQKLAIALCIQILIFFFLYL